MKLYSKGDNFKLYEGNMLEMLDAIAPASVDAVVTDPPYELNFMNKGWDNSGIAFNPDTWRKCYAVLKSGGYLLAFGGSRTYHRIACAIEDAGFEVRDCIIWLYGSGFPKSMNISKGIDKTNAPTSELAKRWQGWGTALKPAYEPVIMARKPCEGSCIANVIKYGTGGINLDACRVGEGTGELKEVSYPDIRGDNYNRGEHDRMTLPAEDRGRHPSNVILTYGADDYEEVCGGMPDTKGAGGMRNDEKTNSNMRVPFADHKSGDHYGDDGNASRYFYTAKASRRDRDEGLGAAELQAGGTYKFRTDGSLDGKIPTRKNTHPTVKPVDLMQYLVRLVTPEGGVILDPFNGSGSTGKAVMYENNDRGANYQYIGIELTPEYLPIADARIRYAAADHDPNEFYGYEPVNGQMSIFDIIEGGNE
jgi:site-specific DNA-methyltransferase (adenine-specific)